MPITAKTKIINAALSHLGEPGFDDIEASPAPPKLAKALAQIDQVQDWVLRRHPWLCAMTYASIDPANRAGNFKYGYVFDLPDTCIRVFEVQGVSKYAKGTATVSDAQKVVMFATTPGPLHIAFVERKPWEAYDADMVTVMGYELGARLAGPIQNDLNLAAALHKSALQMLSLAMSSESEEEGGQDEIAPSGLAAVRRLGAF